VPGDQASSGKKAAAREKSRLGQEGERDVAGCLSFFYEMPAWASALVPRKKSSFVPTSDSVPKKIRNRKSDLIASKRKDFDFEHAGSVLVRFAGSFEILFPGDEAVIPVPRQSTGDLGDEVDAPNSRGRRSPPSRGRRGFHTCRCPGPHRCPVGVRGDVGLGDGDDAADAARRELAKGDRPTLAPAISAAWTRMSWTFWTLPMIFGLQPEASTI
jgi:hypothetical protein